MPDPTRSILLGGLTGFGMSLMFAWIPGVGPLLCCAALTGTGLLAVWHRVATTRQAVSGGEGVRLGGQAGLVAFIASTALVALSWLAAGRPNIASQVRQYGAQLEGAGVPPETVEMGARALDTPQFVIGMVLVWAFIHALLGLLGGAIGAGVFKPAEPPGPKPGA